MLLAKFFSSTYAEPLLSASVLSHTCRALSHILCSLTHPVLSHTRTGCLSSTTWSGPKRMPRSVRRETERRRVCMQKQITRPRSFSKNPKPSRPLPSFLPSRHWGGAWDECGVCACGGVEGVPGGHGVSVEGVRRTLTPQISPHRCGAFPRTTQPMHWAKTPLRWNALCRRLSSMARSAKFARCTQNSTRATAP